MIGLSFVAVAILGTFDFANDFELITNSPYLDKVPVFVLLMSSLLGTYVSVFQIWREFHEKVHYQFAVVYAILLVVASLLIILWLSDANQAVEDAFNAINFPNDVDELTTEIKISLINSASSIFKLLLGIGAITLGFIFIGLKRSFSTEN